MGRDPCGHAERKLLGRTGCPREKPSISAQGRRTRASEFLFVQADVLQEPPTACSTMQEGQQGPASHPSGGELTERLVPASCCLGAAAASECRAGAAAQGVAGSLQGHDGAGRMQ